MSTPVHALNCVQLGTSIIIIRLDVFMLVSQCTSVSNPLCPEGQLAGLFQSCEVTHQFILAQKQLICLVLNDDEITKV